MTRAGFHRVRSRPQRQDYWQRPRQPAGAEKVAPILHGEMDALENVLACPPPFTGNALYTTPLLPHVHRRHPAFYEIPKSGDRRKPIVHGRGETAGFPEA